MSRGSGAGFSMLEAIVALAVVGVGATALLLALSQERRSRVLTEQWAREERRATWLLMDRLGSWEQLRTDPARRAGLDQQGEDEVLGDWSWQARPRESAPGQPVGLYHVELRWAAPGGIRTVGTDAALRILP